jgi:hypothetical protein
MKREIFNNSRAEASFQEVVTEQQLAGMLIDERYFFKKERG